MTTYFDLFLGFVQVGLFSIGGGYAAIPLIRDQALSRGWLTMSEFTDLVTIAEMTPGPIALNAATFVGMRTGGVIGALVASVSVILPSLVIVTLLAYFYQKYSKTDVMQTLLSGVRPAVVALIGSAALSIFVQAIFAAGQVAFENVRILSVVLFAGALFLIRRMKWSPILVMALCGVVNLAAELVFNS